MIGIVIVLFFPGYAIQAALFPNPKDLDGWTRLTFSFGFSIIIIPPLAIICDAANFGINITTIVTGILLVFLVGTAVAVIVRIRQPLEYRERMIGERPTCSWWISGKRNDRILQVLLLSAGLIASVSAFYMYAYPPVESSTEFYLQGISIPAPENPRLVYLNEEFWVELGIVNHEGLASEYNVTFYDDQGQILGKIGPIFLVDDEMWQGGIYITMTQVGDHQRILILLERVDSPWPYRSLRLWVNIVEKNNNFNQQET